MNAFLFSSPATEAIKSETESPLRQKTATSPKRIEGELPPAPASEKDVPEWWNEATTVLDRVRKETNDSLEKVESQINASNIKKLYEENKDTNSFSDFYKDRLENLEDALGIDGSAMGTGNEQEMDNKIIGGGSF
tara:strand:+ start:724 stop:1128 length:405 start_codon:yes stop_codon:yes gene_type:complete